MRTTFFLSCQFLVMTIKLCLIKEFPPLIPGISLVFKSKGFVLIREIRYIRKRQQNAPLFFHLQFCHLK